jgi:MFS family permease
MSVTRGGVLTAVSGGLPGDFWKLWASSAASNLADGIALVVLPLLAVRLTDSPAAVAGLAIAAQVPTLFLTLVAGGLADRLDRRRTMLSVQVLRVAVMGTLAGLTIAGLLSLPVLYASVFLLGVGEAFFDTNAQAVLPSVVGRDRLVIANGRLFAAETVMNTFVGPPLGGILIAVAAPLALSGAAAGFVLAGTGLLLMTGTYRAERTREQRRLVTEIGEGIAYLTRHRLLLTLSGMVALGRLGSAGIFALLPLYAVAPGPMGLSEPAFGLLLVAMGVGSILGSLIVGRLVALFGRPGVLLLATVVFSVGVAVPAVTTDAVIVAAGLFVAGVAIMSWNVTNVSLRQAILPPHLMGRVHATHRFLATLAGVAGAVASGVIGELFGLPAVFLIGALVAGSGVLGGLVVTEERSRGAEAR